MMKKLAIAAVFLLSSLNIQAEQPVQVGVDLSFPPMIRLQKFMEGMAEKVKVGYGEKTPLFGSFHTDDIPSLVNPAKDLGVKTQVDLDVYPQVWVKGWSKKDPQASVRNIFRCAVLEIRQPEEKVRAIIILTPQYRAFKENNSMHWKLGRMESLAFSVSRNLARTLPGNTHLSWSIALRPTVQRVLLTALERI